MIDNLKAIANPNRNPMVVETMIEVVSVMKKLAIHCLILPHQAQAVAQGIMGSFFLWDANKYLKFFETFEDIATQEVNDARILLDVICVVGLYHDFKTPQTILAKASELHVQLEPNRNENRIGGRLRFDTEPIELFQRNSIERIQDLSMTKPENGLIFFTLLQAEELGNFLSCL